jgi:hypothetical protein
MSDRSTMTFDGNLHIPVPKAIRHSQSWLAAKREAGRLKRVADAEWNAKKAPVEPQGEQTISDCKATAESKPAASEHVTPPRE